jgi:hypothetical protein
MMRNTELFMSLWRSYRPVICKVHGYAVAGGSDIALCADTIVMADDAEIGYMPTRVWGCPTTAAAEAARGSDVGRGGEAARSCTGPQVQGRTQWHAPGATQFTVTPWGPSSRASIFVSMITPAFAEELSRAFARRTRCLMRRGAGAECRGDIHDLPVLLQYGFSSLYFRASDVPVSCS